MSGAGHLSAGIFLRSLFQINHRRAPKTFIMETDRKHETTRNLMAESRSATHRHKTHGPIVLLESTAQLAKVLVLDRGDEIWVKRVDLTEGSHVVSKKCPRKSSSKDRPNSSANSRYRIVRSV